MKVDMLGLQAFVAVAEHAGFQRAAAGLHLTQAALSRRLQNLEAFLGVRLVERTTRSVALTELGAGFLPHARRLLADLTDALLEIRETGKARRGEVTLACVPTVGVQFLPRVLGAYCERYPDNRVRVLDHASADVAAAVLRREAEFGIAIAGYHHPELAGVQLLQDSFALVCRIDHPLARATRLRWKQLEPYPLIVPGAGSSNRPLLDGVLSQTTLSLRAYYEVQRSSTAVGMVAQGVAAAIVPRLALQKGTYPDVRMIPLVEPAVTRSFALLRRRTAVLSPAAQALYDMICETAKVAADAPVTPARSRPARAAAPRRAGRR
jgi:DNA-binding transcriptional LysR family regulator